MPNAYDLHVHRVLALLLVAALLAGCQALNYSPFDLLQTPRARGTLPAVAAINPARSVTPAPELATAGALTCRVSVPEALNLRAGPGTQFSVTHWLKPGQVLTVLHEPARGDWIRVATADDQRGWINGGYCTSIGGKP